MERLQRDGYLVCGPVAAGEELARWRESFVSAARHMPEFKTPDGPRVMGGFAALGNAASFHNPVVRWMRQAVMLYLVERVIWLPPGRLLEQVIDRMLLRPRGASPSAEGWHVDASEHARPGDVVLGGFLNLDPFDHHFTGVPGSHRDPQGPPGGRTGFVGLDDGDALMKGFYRAASERIRVPPGCILLFDELLVHAVTPSRCPSDMARLFLGWRITSHAEPMIPGVQDLISRQAVMPLKSGQTPPMYARLHWTNFPDSIVEFSEENIVEACLEDRTIISGKRAGEVLRVVVRHMPDLVRLRAPYPAYTDRERRMHEPGEEWVLAPGPGMPPRRARLRRTPRQEN